MELSEDKQINKLTQKITSKIDLKTRIPSLEVGDIIHLQEGDRYIIFLVTKKHSSDVTEYKNIHNTIVKLKRFCEENKLTKVAVPQIGIKSTMDTLNWSQIRAMFRYVSKGTPKNILMYSEVELSQVDKIDIIKLHHDSLLGGHMSVSKTIKRIAAQIQWKSIRKDVKKYIKSCKSCQQNKYSKKIKIPMAITTTSTKPFKKIFLDVVGKLPTSYKNNSYILTIQDDLTKF